MNGLRKSSGRVGHASGMALRWRREDFDSVKHDKYFSEWKVLVAPSDWKEQAAGRNGGDRFRYRNLPSPHAGAGIYELGITLPAWKTEDLLTETGSLKSEDIIVVYVGHADHIRNRLQRYGQAGAHLEGLRSPNFSNFSTPSQSPNLSTPSRSSKTNSAHGDDRHTSNDEEPIMSKLKYRVDGDRYSSISISRKSTTEKQLSTPNRHIPVGGSVSPAHSSGRGSPRGPRLFSEVFALGCSIAYRWSSTTTIELAEFVVSELADAFDYAWNRGRNSEVRSQDIIEKIVLGKRRHSTSCCSINSSRWARLIFKRKLVGIKILGAYKPAEGRTRRRPGQRGAGRGPFLLLIKSPHLMILGGKSVKHCEFTKINIPVDRCGVMLENGLVCNALPQMGRKRCLVHMDVNRSRQLKSSQAQDFRSGSSGSDNHSADSYNMNSHSTPRRSAPAAPSSPCFPSLTTRKSPKIPEETRKRGSVSFNTWLCKSEILRVKSFEWLVAMEEIKGRGNDNCSTSPILKPDVQSSETNSNEQIAVRVSRASLNLAPVVETVPEQDPEFVLYAPEVDCGMPCRVVPQRSNTRWPPAPMLDSYATTYNPPQFPRISFT